MSRLTQYLRSRRWAAADRARQKIIDNAGAAVPPTSPKINATPPLPHFATAYINTVDDLVRTLPLDEAMSIAVGGAFEETGTLEADVMEFFGLREGMTIVDLGCGSGRLAHALGQRLKLDYCGIDVVPALLAYAKSKTPEHYRFIHSHALTLPVTDASVDFVSVFSVFTHIHHTETYLYLEDIKRVLRPSGKLVLSFLELGAGLLIPSHWNAFVAAVESRRNHLSGIMHVTIERNVLALWCEKLGYRVEVVVDGTTSPWGGRPFGQSIAVLAKD